MDGLSIKRVNAKTYSEEIYALQAVCLPDDVPCAADAGEWWLAYHEDEAVGFACMCPNVRWVNCGFLARAGVVPAYRGHGIQKKFIRVRVNRARMLGWTHVMTDTTDNLASSNSLIACGFKLYRPSKPWSLKRALYFRKKL